MPPRSPQRSQSRQRWRACTLNGIRRRFDCGGRHAGRRCTRETRELNGWNPARHVPEVASSGATTVPCLLLPAFCSLSLLVLDANRVSRHHPSFCRSNSHQTDNLLADVDVCTSLNICALQVPSDYVRGSERAASFGPASCNVGSRSN